MNNARAFEHVSRAANGKLTFVTDNPSGFGFHSLQIENDSTPPVTNPPVTNPPVTNPPATGNYYENIESNLTFARICHLYTFLLFLLHNM